MTAMSGLTAGIRRAAAFLRAVLAAIVKGAWYVGCDCCGTTLKKGRRTRWFLTREAADRAGLGAGWQTAAGRSDSEICPACLKLQNQALPDLRVYRTELWRDADGGWCLYRDCELLDGLDTPEDAPVAMAWARLILGRHIPGDEAGRITWVNGQDCPDGESGYWVAEPHDSPAASPRTYTHPDVFTIGVEQGWAEAETDPARIGWPARQARAAIPFEVIGGRPVNPCEKTGIRYGRNEMGFWGEQQMADALVTITFGGGQRHLLMIERGDGYGWAVPGGHVEPGETGTEAAIRELAEETGLTVTPAACQVMPPRYVPDPRASDEAWAVTVPVHIDLGACDALPDVAGGDDARRAEWLPASTYAQLAASLGGWYGGQVFTAHTAMLSDFLGTPAGES